MPMVFFAPSGASAGETVDVTFGAGFPVSESNLMPGDTFSREFTVENKTNADQPLMMRLDEGAGSGTLDKKMLVKISWSGGEYSAGTLFALYGKAFEFDTLGGGVGTSKTYTITFIFNTTAGNEYQNSNVVFDVSVGINAEPEPTTTVVTTAAVTTTTPDDGGGGGGNKNKNKKKSASVTVPFFGTVNIPFVGGDEGDADAAEESVAGVETEQTEQGENGQTTSNETVLNGQIAGEEVQCAQISLWLWIFGLLLLVVLLAFARRLFASARSLWIARGALFLATLGVWFFFDTCRDAWWAPICAGILFLLMAIFSRQRAR